MTLKSIAIATITILCTTTILIACKSAKIPLSDAEIEFSKKLTQDYQCEVKLQHDYEAINDNRKNGAFWIQLRSTNKELCSRDTASLKKIATDIVTIAKGIISHKENYSYITVNFKTYVDLGQDAARTTCYKKLEVEITNLNNIRIVDWVYEN